MTMMRSSVALVLVFMLASFTSADGLREKVRYLRASTLGASAPDLKQHLPHTGGISFLQEEVLLNSPSMSVLAERSTILSTRTTLFCVPLLLAVPTLCSILLHLWTLVSVAVSTKTEDKPEDQKVVEDQKLPSCEKLEEIHQESDQEIDQPEANETKPLATPSQPLEEDIANPTLTPALQSNLCEGELMLLEEIRELPVYYEIVPPRQCYDCNFVCPQEDTVSVRLQGVVLALSQSFHAPIADRESVFYSTSASELRLDRVRTPPIAFHSAYSDFELELLGTNPPTKVRIHGDRVALFDMVDGQEYRQALLQDASERLHNFVRTHKTAKGTKVPGSSGVLEFTESSLNVGATVTCVGKLKRKPTGELELMPNDCHGLGWTSDKRGSFMIDKVLVSDNPSLFSH